MPHTLSPLRYPGGKAQLGPYLAELIELNSINDGYYLEPYAGGAGAAWYLLLKGHVKFVGINDASLPVASFWRSVFKNTDELLRLISDTEITVSEHQKQKNIFKDSKNFSEIDVGFAAFFLNRTNRSGIFGAGPIGGYKQQGDYRIDARFNKTSLLKKIQALALYASRVEVTQKDALDFISEDVIHKLPPEKCLIYCDPPYYENGKQLYLNYYIAKDHQKLAERLRRIKRFRWLLSYDNSAIIKNLYPDCHITPLGISHSANIRKRGQELLITPNQTNIPLRESIEVA